VASAAIAKSRAIGPPAINSIFSLLNNVLSLNALPPLVFVPRWYLKPFQLRTRLT
jgi:hypothetical protein